MPNMKVQPRNGRGSIADQFKTGMEWQPGRPSQKPGRHKNEVVQPSEQIKGKVSDLLMDFFKREQPPADSITVLPNSLRLVDIPHDIWIGSVQTIVYFPKTGPHEHVSRVRFRVLQVKQGADIEKHKFSIHHNHVIFV